MSPPAAPAPSTAATWVQVDAAGIAPSPRADFAMAYDAADGYLLLFGGETSQGGGLGDTWTFQSGQWTNITGALAQAPSSRIQAVMAYDAADGYVVMFGGVHNISTSQPYNDTWIFRGGSWTNLTPQLAVSPPGRM